MVFAFWGELMGVAILHPRICEVQTVMPCKALDWQLKPIFKILFGRDSYEFIFLRPFPLCSCESSKWSWIKWFSHVSHLTFHRAQVSSQFSSEFPGNSAEIQSGFVNLGGILLTLQAPPAGEHAALFPIWRTQGPALLCVYVGSPPQLQASVSFPEFQVYHPWCWSPHPRENKNSRAGINDEKDSIASSSGLARI